MIEQMNHISQHWWDWMFSMFWQVGVLIVLVALLDLVIRKWAWPQLRYALWLLVLVKLILPPSLTSPTSLTSNLQPLAKEALAAQMQKSEPTKLTSPTSNPPPMPVLEYESITKPMPLVVQTPPPISVPLVVGESPVPANSDILPAEKENLSAETITVAAVEESVAAEAPTVAPKVKLHGKFYVMLVWSLGIWILAGWFILHWRQLTRQVRKQSTTDKLPDWFFDSLRETAELLGLRRIPKVAVSSKIATPAVFCLFQPTLLMPTANLDKMSRRDARHVLLHELAHIKRRDPLVHTFNLLLQIVYWYNPLLWLVRRQLQHLRELCCDATVAKILKENTMAYRETLLETAKRLLVKPVEPGLGLLGLFEDSNRLLVRLRWLEKKTWKHSRLRLGVVLMALAFMGACILPMAAIENPQPSMLLTGIVTDADTGNPIAGAKVSDDGYGTKPYRQGVTDENGNYQYLTWPEEHNIVVQADGYKSQRKVLTTSLLQNENKKVLNFKLKTTPPEQLRKQILEEGERFIGKDGGYGDDEPVGSVKQKKQIQLEAQFIRVPTTLISSLKLDQKTEKGEVPGLLLDMEKGEVATSLLDAVQIDFLIKSLRSSKETLLISAPRVITNAGETAEIFIGQDRPDSKFAQGLRLRVLPTLDNQDRIRLDIQLSQKAPRSTDEAEYATGFYENQVTLQARLQSGQSLLATLPEDFLTNFHTKKSSTPTQILMILKARISPTKTKKLPVVTQKPKPPAPIIELLETTQTDIPARPKPLWPESMYSQDRPWKWYVLMDEIRDVRRKKSDLETQISQIMIQRQQMLKTKSKDHPEIKLLGKKIEALRDEYSFKAKQYEELHNKIQDYEEKRVQYQEVTNQLRFLQQQQQQLEQRLLDTRIEYESANSVQQQKKAEILLPALQKQRDRVEAEINLQQEQLKSIRRQMN